MNYCTRRRIRHQIQNLKHSFAQFDCLPFNDVLPIAWLEQFALTGGCRNRLFTPLITLKAFLWQALSEDGSCKKAVASVLGDRLQQGLSQNSVNTGPYCKARQRLSLPMLEEGVKITGASLHQKAEPYWKWHDYNVVMVDGTTVLMSDTPANQAAFPQQSNQKPGLGFPITRLVGLVSLSVGAVIDYAQGSYQGKGSGESSLFSQIIHSIQPDDLLLGDRYYCTYAIVALMQCRGAPVAFKNHANKKSDFRRGKKLGPKDHLIDWKKPKRKPVWMSEEQYGELPDSLQVRELAINGVVYVTTLFDAKKYHKKEIAELFNQRWKIELDIRSIKTDMKMEMLRCKTPGMVKKEIAAHLLAYNLIRTNIAQAAYQYRQQPRMLSIKATIQLLDETARRGAHLVKMSLETYGAFLHKAIASTKIGRRKRKPQPRAVKRRPKAYPLLSEPREIACQKLVRTAR